MNTVLVVDDKPSIREAVRAMLEGHYQILEATNGEEAVALLMDHEVDVVVLDINMPVTNGWETLRIINDEHNGWPNIQVIMLTVQNAPETAIKAWTLGAAFYLPKPFRSADLIGLIEKALVS